MFMDLKHTQWTRNDILTCKQMDTFKLTMANRSGYARVDHLLDGLGPTRRLEQVDILSLHKTINKN